ncbi:unnamed protein product [[Actinomadura] parvosata subsp. kistnae]|uniref:CHAT domain-containing protein n=1 Tax=[Actinomadura] parvosata TaxID=1955412 RepID=UPI000D2C7A67|nr:CHAT domain-containing protein [Nonomuraea sp. ATCC 55076]SPL90482.1 unnamed protein product [Actinomadura parvosata subsp. kistnae]
MPFVLEMRDVRDRGTWTWVLTTKQGEPLAEACIRLGRDHLPYLYQQIRELRSGGALLAQSRAVEEISKFLTQEIFHPRIIEVLARNAPATVRIKIPPAGRFLADYPLELTGVGQEIFARRGIVLVHEFDLRAGPRIKKQAGGPLRMLAVFSGPDAAGLGPYEQRHELAAAVRHAATSTGKSIELRILHYGTTRDSLRRTIEEYPGWDVLHLAGHGTAGRLVLERPDGSPDPISMEDLTELLLPTRGRLKLAVLVSCDRGNGVAVSALQELGLAKAAEQLPSGPHDVVEPGRGKAVELAVRLADELDVAAVATRYPVSDEYAGALARELYSRLLGWGMPLREAFGSAVAEASRPVSSTRPPLSAGAAMLIGARGAKLRLMPPRGELVHEPFRSRLGSPPPKPLRFVGRTDVLGEVSRALAAASKRCAVMLTGGTGVGKTACALELIHHQADAFSRIAWWSAPRPATEADIVDVPAQLAGAWQDRLGLPLVRAMSNERELRRLLPRLSDALRKQRLLLVLDGAETLLSADGTWLDERCRMLIEAIGSHGGESRLLMTSRRALDALPGLEMDTVRVGPLGVAESVMLAARLPNLRPPLLGARPEACPQPKAPVSGAELAWLLEEAQGNPRLLELAAEGVAEPEDLPAGDGYFLLGHGGDRSEEATTKLLRRWTGEIVARLEPLPRRLLALLSRARDADRSPAVLEPLWDRLGTGSRLKSVANSLILANLADIVTGDDGAMALRLLPELPTAAGDEPRDDDVLLADHWLRIHAEALRRDGEGAKPNAVRAGLAAVPYLVRRGRWAEAGRVLAQAVRLDDSPGMTRLALDYLSLAPDGADGGRINATILLIRTNEQARSDPDLAGDLLRHALHQVREEGDEEIRAELTGELIDLLARYRSPGEALPWAVGAVHQVESERLRLAAEARRLRLLTAMRRHHEVQELARVLVPEHDPVPVELERSYEEILQAARSSALAWERWSTAIAWTHRMSRHRQHQGVQPWALALIKMADWVPLFRLGRLSKAERLLDECQHVFMAHRALPELRLAVSARAEICARLARPDEAAMYEEIALRIGYDAYNDAEDIARHHHNLAGHLRDAGRPRLEVVAHRLAAAMLYSAADCPHQLGAVVRALAENLSEGGAPLPRDPHLLVVPVEHGAGMRFTSLFSTLVPAEQKRVALLKGVLDAVGQVAARERMAPAAFWTWDPSGPIGAASAGDAAHGAVSFIGLDEQTDWTPLAEALRRVVHGERDERELATGLDKIDRDIVGAVLRGL